MLRGARPTVRGIVLAVIGVVIAVAAGLVGEPDLMWIGLFLAALPLLSVLFVILFQPKLEYERSLTPAEVPVGDNGEATVLLRNRNPIGATTLELMDQAPAALGGGARFVVARAFGSWKQGVRYAFRASQRGRYMVGPLRAKAGDPLGLAVAVMKPAGDPTQMRVTPRIWPIAEVHKGMGIGAAGESAPQRSGQAGQDDVLVREHRHGDDIRRVHWRMSAKQGELMVRMEEHPWDPSALVVIDIRRSAHSGTDAESSLEWAISAGTSVAVRMSDLRYRLLVAGGSGMIFEDRQLKGAAQRRAIVDAMTDVVASDERDLDAALGESESLDATGSLVVFSGVLTTRDAASLVSLGRRMSKPCILLPDATAWQIPAPEQSDAIRLLTRSGWAIEQFAPGDSVSAAWQRMQVRQAAA